MAMHPKNSNIMHNMEQYLNLSDIGVYTYRIVRNMAVCTPIILIIIIIICDAERRAYKQSTFILCVYLMIVARAKPICIEHASKRERDFRKIEIPNIPGLDARHIYTMTHSHTHTHTVQMHYILRPDYKPSSRLPNNVDVGQSQSPWNKIEIEDLRALFLIKYAIDEDILCATLYTAHKTHI